MSSSIIKRGLDIYNQQGWVVFGISMFRYLARKTHLFIRPLLPKKGFQTKNGVKTGIRKLGDGLYGPFSSPNSEDGIVSGH